MAKDTRGRVLVWIPDRFVPLVERVQAARGSYTKVDAIGYILDCVERHPEILGLDGIKQETKTEVSDGEGIINIQKDGRNLPKDRVRARVRD